MWKQAKQVASFCLFVCLVNIGFCLFNFFLSANSFQMQDGKYSLFSLVAI